MILKVERKGSNFPAGRAQSPFFCTIRRSISLMRLARGKACQALRILGAEKSCCQQPPKQATFPKWRMQLERTLEFFLTWVLVRVDVVEL